MQSSFIWPIDRALSSTITLSQSGPKSDSNEGVLRVPQSSSIIKTSPSDRLVSNPDSCWWKGLTPLKRCSQCILLPQPTEQLIIWGCKVLTICWMWHQFILKFFEFIPETSSYANIAKRLTHILCSIQYFFYSLFFFLLMSILT